MKLNTHLVMTAQDIEALNSLPDNMPENKLKAKQIETVNNIYHKYIGIYIDQQSYGKPLHELDRENERNWPSGPRMKQHEAKRVVLHWLINEQRYLTATTEELMKHFYTVCGSRPAYTKFVSKAWNY